MRSQGLFLALLAAACLPGCATYSFAPPRVDLRNVEQDSESFNLSCGIKHASGENAIQRTISGAVNLTDNFLYAYRCAERQTANGRQGFEVPAMLVGLGGAVAAAAGAPAAAALGTGAAVAALNGGKSYYAPRDKLPILSASVDALVCIKTTSLGLDAYGSTLITAATGNVNEKGGKVDMDGNAAVADPAADQQNLKATQAVQQQQPNGANVAISATDQYFEMVEGALLGIENITAQRLNSVGAYSSDAIITEFQAIQQKQKAAEDNAATVKAQAVAQSALIADAAATAQRNAVSPPPPPTPLESPDSDASAKMAPPPPPPSPPPPPPPPPASPSAPDLASVAPIQAQDKMVLAADPIAAMVAVQKAPLDKTQQQQLESPGNILVVQKGKPVVVPLTPQQTAIANVLLDIRQLQPKLDACILRAKL